jgi:hypothetical protein
MSNKPLPYSRLSASDKRALQTIETRTTYIADSWIINIKKAMDLLDKKKSKNQVNHLIVSLVLGKLAFLARPMMLHDRSNQETNYISQLNNDGELLITYKELSEMLHSPYQVCYRSIHVLCELNLIEKRNIINENKTSIGIAIKINYNMKDAYSTLKFEDINAKKEIEEITSDNNTQPIPQECDAKDEPKTTEEKIWDECKERIGEKIDYFDAALIKSTTFERIDNEKRTVCLKTPLDNNEFMKTFLPLLRGEYFQKIVNTVFNDYPQFAGKRIFIVRRQ